MDKESLDKDREEWERDFLLGAPRLNWEDLAQEVRDSEPVLGVLREVCRSGCEIARDKALGAKSFEDLRNIQGIVAGVEQILEAIETLRKLSVEVKNDE